MKLDNILVIDFTIFCKVMSACKYITLKYCAFIITDMADDDKLPVDTLTKEQNLVENTWDNVENQSEMPVNRNSLV